MSVSESKADLSASGCGEEFEEELSMLDHGNRQDMKKIHDGVSHVDGDVIDVNNIGEEGFAEMSMLEFSHEFTEAETLQSQVEVDLDNLGKAYEAQEKENKDLKDRLQKRSDLIEEIRTAYLRDVVTIKHCLTNVLDPVEKKAVLDEYAGRLPSLDLTQTLVTYAPPNAHLRFKQCGECGGHVDIVINDSDHVAKLTDMIGTLKDREARLRLTLATEDARTEKMKEDHNNASKQHAEEKRFLYSELKKLKEEVTKTSTENNRLSKNATEYREEIREHKDNIVHLEVKAEKLILVEEQAKELQTNLQESKQEAGNQDAEIADLQKSLSQQMIKVKQQSGAITKHEGTIKSVEEELEASKKSEKKFKDMNVFLEENADEANVKIVKLEGDLMDIRETMKFNDNEKELEIEGLRKQVEDSKEEIGRLEIIVDERNIALEAAKEALRAAEQLVIQKEATITSRNTEIATLTAAMEAQREELAAMKQFLSDTVKSAKTPSKNRRRFGDDDDDSGSVGNIWHASDTDDSTAFTSVVDNNGNNNIDTDNNSVISELQMEAFPIEEDEEGGDEPMPTAIKIQKNANSTIVAEKVNVQEALVPRAIKSNLPSTLPPTSSESSESQPAALTKNKSVSMNEDVEIFDSDKPILQKTLTGDGSSIIDVDEMSSVGFGFEEGKDSDKAAYAHQLTRQQSSSANVAVDITTEYSASTVAPPTAKAAPKRRTQVQERGQKKESQVDLLPPLRQCAGEIMLRNELIKAIQTAIGSSNTKRCVNAAREVLANYGEMLTNSLQTLWKSVVLSKKGLDMLTKTQSVAGGVLSCSEKNKEQYDKIPDMINEIVPIIGTNTNSKLFQKWVQKVKLDSEFAQVLKPTDETDDNGAPIYSDFKNIFGETSEDYKVGIADSNKALDKMGLYHDTEMPHMNTDLVDMLKDWSEAKLVFVDMESRIKLEKENTRKEMMVEVAEVAKELGLANGRYDAAKAYSKSMEVKMETIELKLKDLQEFPEQLSIAEAEISLLQRTKTENAETIQDLTEQLEKMKLENDSLRKVLAEKDDYIESQDSALKEATEFNITNEQKAIHSQQQREAVQEKLNSVVANEKARIVGMVDKFTDTTLLTSDASQQTDFLTPGMGLRTVMVKDSKKVGARPFGVPFVDAMNVKSQADIVASVKIAAGKSNLKTFNSLYY